ncbi:hypothetical protein GCM10020255_019860 [Rhodococcus baikonurensis]
MTSDSNNSGRQPLPKRFTIGVPVATLASAYATPPLLYWWLGTDRWDQFWATAATPYGAATAGFAAIGAAAIALYNGTKQRETESRHASNQLKVAEGQLRHAQTTAEFDHGTRTLRELRDRFTTASQHLANTSTTIQQAGAYSLGSLVNDWLADDNQQEAQVCIDVLCTYLRTHHQEAAMHAGKPHGDDYNYNAPPQISPSAVPSPGSSTAISAQTTRARPMEPPQLQLLGVTPPLHFVSRCAFLRHCCIR